MEEEVEKCVSSFLIETQFANMSLSFSLHHKITRFQDEFQDAISKVCEEQVKLTSPQLESADDQLGAFLSSLLPPCPQVFFGRSSVVETAVQQLSTFGQSHVAILGAPGIGKTAVALATLHHPTVAIAFGRNRHFISCDALPTAESFLTALGRYCSIEGKATKAQIIARLRGRSRSLFVFDNFETPWEHVSERAQVEELLSSLADIHNLHILLTLRGAERPAGITWKRPFLPPLSPLDHDAAKQIFVAVSDVADNDIYLPKLLEELDNVPLAVIMMANLSQHTSCEALLAQWHRDKTKMLTRGSDDRLSSVDISIQVSLSSQRLQRSPLAMKVLQIVSLLPDGVFQPDLQAMISDDPAQLPAAISALRQVALLYIEHGSDRLRSLSPIREYVQRHDPIHSADLSRVQSYFFQLTEFMDTTGTFRDKEKLEHIRSQLVNVFTVLLRTLETETPPVEAIEATLRMGDFIEATALSVQLLPLAITAAKRVGQPRLELECRNFGYTAVVGVQSVARSRADIQAGLAALEGPQDDDDVAMDMTKAASFRILADCARLEADFENAIAYSNQAIQIYSKHNNVQRQAEALKHLSWIFDGACQPKDARRTEAYLYLDQGLLPLAEAACRKAQEMHHQIIGDSRRYASSVCVLAEVLQAQGRLSEAQLTYEKAAKLSVKLRNPNYVATISRMMGWLALDQGDYEIGKARLHVALRHYSEPRSAIHQGLCIFRIGDAELRQGNYTTAWAHLRKARDLYHEDGRRGSIFDASALRLMGKAALGMRDADAALTCYAVAIAICRNASKRLITSECLQGLGDVYLFNGDRDSARACYTATLASIKYLGARKNIAECLLRLADVAETLEECRSFLERACNWFRRAEDSVGEASCIAKLADL
ncbi:TPR-like protein [Sistotremastrum niveocremeum HHB9708]|uniref:TPR-like protein n=1 Tax=Sistotremastrum niveocremeum HHB9708 TaxID=1314777 RepID=A0A164N4Q7_9AGAM|nr:TPR-like protein [Sistotremastrum niveocremeum HHB9708]